MKIKVTDFAKRHFDKTFGGTKILDMSPDVFESKINDIIYRREDHYGNISYVTDLSETTQKVMAGYAPFCKLVAIRNFTDARVGSMPITLENYQYLRSGYSARRDSELPVFSRWLELPLGKPKADWLILVLYDKEQVDKEAQIEYDKKTEEGILLLDEPDFLDADWGIVAILGQSHSDEEPMKPETMLRNALGVEEGGSGVPLDREAYMKSVKFWEQNATVK